MIYLFLIFLTFNSVAALVIGDSAFNAFKYINYIKISTNIFRNRLVYDIFNNFVENKLIYTSVIYYDPYTVGIICLSNDFESEYSARLATNLWGGGYILPIVSTNIRLCINTWNNGAWGLLLLPTNDQHMFSITNQYDHLYGDSLYRMNFHYAWKSTNDFINDFVIPVSNFIQQYKLKYVALAYRMPSRAFPGDDNKGNSILYEFYKFSNIEYPNRYKYFPNTIYSTNTYFDIVGIDESVAQFNTNCYMFSFACRTFNDTTNLLIKSANFDKNFDEYTNAYVVWDTKTDRPFISRSYESITNICKTSLAIVREDPESTSDRITNVNGKIFYIRSFGLHDYSRTNPDSMWKTLYKFQTVPVAIAVSIESYNLSSFWYTLPTKTHQTRLYDCFDINCNGKNDYSSTYGCVFGHVSEPGWLCVDTEIFFYYIQKGHPYIDAFYKSQSYLIGNNKKLLIICGHPFMRLRP